MFENTKKELSPIHRSILYLSIFVGIAIGSITWINQVAAARAGVEAPSLTSGPASTRIKHVIWIWFENREPDDINATTAPFFTNFASTHASFTSYFGVAHPSQPNYLAAFSGSTQGVLNDNHFSFPATTDNIAKQLTAAGRSWRLYAQDYPGNCFNGDTSTGGVDGPGVAGQYVRKHNPAISFESVSLDPVQCANIQPLANFDPTVSFSVVIPNMINDMHDGTTAQGDAFLQAFMPLITGSPDSAETLVVVTFDEGDSADGTGGGGHIYTAAAAPWLNNKTITTTYDHFSLLRTTEDIFGLPHLGGAITASTISEILPNAPARADFDGDGKSDESVFRPSEGNWYAIRSGGGGVLFENWGIASDVLAPGDYDGDGVTDLAIFRPTDGRWWIIRSSDTTVETQQWGATGDIPVAGDYDGDGTTDMAIWRPSDGNWFIIESRDGVQSANWGVGTDKPVPGDYDGDGKTDIAVWRPSDGNWFVFGSRSGVAVTNWGVGTDRPVPADYDGDGKDDVAVFRPSDGNWFVIGSRDGLQVTNWGVASDITVPGDYDGDGKTDVAVFRPSDGNWFIIGTKSGLQIVKWGTTGDIPVPSKYIP